MKLNTYDLEALDIVFNYLKSSPCDILNTFEILDFIKFENPDIFKRINKDYVVCFIQRELIIRYLVLLNDK